jgi:ubiquinone/menaquinone biosynthesis C-methylase UbiE
MSTDNPDKSSYMFDAESPEELSRLMSWDGLMTRNMGGPLSGVTDPSSFRNILDLACGPGGWVLDSAFTLPDADVAGVDISRIMVDYANARARSQQLPNASFGVMDITQPLDFADASFDLVNARFVATVLPNDKWTPFLAECTRILRPGGTLRITEFVKYVTTSPSYARFDGLLLKAMQQIGYGFAFEGNANNVTIVLPHMFRELGYQDIKMQAYVLDFSIDTEAWADAYHNLEVLGHLAQPLLTNLGLIEAEELQQLTSQMLIETHKDDFYGMQHYMTVLGIRSGTLPEG